MPDREKVIRGLECLGGYMHMEADPCAECGYNECQTFAICLGEVARDALALLKEQEAVKPRVDIDTWVCGNCGARIERQSMIGPNVLISETLDVCPNCWKKVKWDE